MSDGGPWRRHLFCLFALLPACSEAPTTHAPHWSAAPQTQGGEACADCHAEIADSWSRSPMARALGPVDLKEFEELPAVHDPASGYTYDFEVHAERAFLVETRPDQPDFRLPTELLYAIGAGEVDRSFATKHGSFQWFAPLEILSTDQGRRAALAPGHMMKAGLRFSNPITSECLGCHTSELPPRAYPLHSDPLPSGWQPTGISCSACHADTASHISWQERELDGEATTGPDPILRPSELTRTQRMSICAACHLQGDARILLSGSGLGPPEPGGDLLATRAVFVAANATDEIGFVSQTERLVASKCYTESSAMVCESCHNPHRSLKEEGERQRVRDACSNCHSGAEVSSSRATEPACSMTPASRTQAKAADKDCVSCHMPKRPVFDVAEVSIHDHFIKKRPAQSPPSNPLRFAENADGDWQRFQWPLDTAPPHLDEPGLWMMALVAGAHTALAVARIDESPGPVASLLPMYHHVRGTLLEGMGREEEALASYRRALELDPETAVSSTNLGLLLARLGQEQQAMQVLSELLERHPAAEGALRNRALVQQQLGNSSASATDLHAAFLLLPSSVLAAALASYCENTGDHSGARNWSMMAQALTPNY